jgi:tripartite-type tricarboxylate transporter receptor subunit TctC
MHAVGACVAAALGLLAAGSASVQAQPYPTRPLRIIVLNTAGSGADVIARLLGARLTAAWGQQAVIDNRAGASGNIGAEIAARAAPDGYTLVMITSQQPIVSALFDKLNYDLLKDFAPISLIASTPMILAVHPSVAAHTTKELIAFAKVKPGLLNYGTAGSGSSAHLATEVFKSMTGTNIVHVPYKGATPAMTDALAGQVQVMITVSTTMLPVVKSGKLRALGVTSLKRTALAPELPTVAETVPGYEWSGWYGLAAPAGTPHDIIVKLHAEQINALGTKAFQDRLLALGCDAIGSTPPEYAGYLRAQVDKMRHAIKLSGARVD